MTDKITIDPQLVREVLDKYIDASKNIMLYASYGEELWEENKDAIVQYLLNIHEFKDLAIKKCAGWGYMIDRLHVDGDIWQITVWDDKESLTIYKKEISLVDMLSAELAAISFCYKQIQENKNNGN